MLRVNGWEQMKLESSRALLIGESHEMLRDWSEQLHRAGYDVSCARSMSDAETEFQEHGLPHTLILFAGSRVETTLEWLKHVAVFAGLPVIVTVPDTCSEKDVLLFWQFSDVVLRDHEVTTREITTRLDRMFSRASGLLHYGAGRRISLVEQVEVDFVDKKVWIKGHDHNLTPSETAIVHVLVAHQGTMVDQQTLLERVWRYPESGTMNNLRVMMHRLRRKLETNRETRNSVIKTVRNIGYMIAVQQ